MRKKITLLCAGCAAVAVISLILVGSLYKGQDGVTFFQKQNVNQYLASVPFEVKENAEYVYPYVAAAPGINSTEKNTYLGSREQVDAKTDFILANVTGSAGSKVVLADSYDDITEKSVDFQRVLTYMDECERDDMGIIFRLSEYNSLESIAAFIGANELGGRAVIAGVHENAIKYVKSFFPRNIVLCEYNSKSNRSFAQIKADGANGIICSAESFNASVFKKATSNKLIVWVDCDDDVYKTILAMKLNVDGIVSSIPDFAKKMGISWDINEFEGYWKNK